MKGLDDMTSRQERGGSDTPDIPLRLRPASGGRAVLGIDPGRHGAAALLRVWPDRDRPRLEALLDASDYAGVANVVPHADLTVIEGQQASPQMGVNSAFGLGLSYGRVLEAVMGNREGEVAVIFPTAWKGSYGLAGGMSGKLAGLRLAEELLVEEKRRWPRLFTRPDQADAVLLAWWGWRKRLLARGAQELQAAGES